MWRRKGGRLLYYGIAMVQMERRDAGRYWVGNILIESRNAHCSSDL